MAIRNIKDPIHPDLQIPRELEDVLSHPVFNRLRFIKQLGLKAYCGRFPSANHTRYEHSIGTMHLAGKLCSCLERNTTDRDLKGSVTQYKELIKLAALLHDIGHGPFSHTIDEVLKGEFNKPHEEVTEQIIKNIMQDSIESVVDSSSIQEICNMILSEHTEHPYLNDIISGELDVDRMDYLIRDAYHTGVEYRFYPDSLIQTMKVSKHPLVHAEELQKYQVDVDTFLKRITDIEFRKNISTALKNIEALSTDHLSIVGETGVVLADTFLVTRKTMYQEVYYEVYSRIAERMMQESILSMLKNKKISRSLFTNVRKYVTLDDYELFALMKHAGGFAEEVVNRIKERKLYEVFLSGPPGKYKLIRDIVMGPKEKQYRSLRKLEQDLANRLKLNKEDILIDEIKVRAFKSERVYVELKGEYPKLLEEASPVARTLANLAEINKVNVYINGEKIKSRREQIRSKAEQLLEGTL